MSQKFYAQHSEIVKVPSIPPIIRHPLVLIIITSIIVLVLGLIMAGQPV